MSRKKKIVSLSTGFPEPIVKCTESDLVFRPCLQTMSASKCVRKAHLGCLGFWFIKNFCSECCYLRFLFVGIKGNLNTYIQHLQLQANINFVHSLIMFLCSLVVKLRPVSKRWGQQSSMAYRNVFIGKELLLSRVKSWVYSKNSALWKHLLPLEFFLLFFFALQPGIKIDFCWGLN